MKALKEYQFRPQTIHVPLHEFTDVLPIQIQVIHFLEQIPGYYRFGTTHIRITSKWVAITYQEIVE